MRPGSSFTLFDPAGRSVLAGVLAVSATLDLSMLPNGPYTLVVHDGERKHMVRVIVQR
jgi:hypothetical protein